MRGKRVAMALAGAICATALVMTASGFAAESGSASASASASASSASASASASGVVSAGDSQAASSSASSAAITTVVEGDKYTPEVRQLADGTLIQRTPTEGSVFMTLDGSYTYHLPDETVPYNTFYLKADSKGCGACHDDLGETLANMEYSHADLRNSYGIQITVQMCLDCHTFGYGYLTNQYSFGSLIHGIHDTEDGGVGCWRCHVATGDGEDMQLWDEAKHWQLRGITPIADVQGEFAFDQDKTTPVDDLFDFGWDYYSLDYDRTNNTATDAPLDQEMFDSWTITVTGEVDNTVTYTLPELIDKFESVTVPLTLQCTLNATGGPLIGNATYTGIRLSDLLAEAAVKDDAGALVISAPDGFAEPLMMTNFSEAYLVYQIDGEPLPWAQGYPVQLLVPGTGAPASVKEVSDITVVTQEDAAVRHEWNGWPKEAGDGAYYTTDGWPYVDDNGYTNKPNVGIFDLQEGQVIQTGVPYEFTGYASSWDKAITGVEFSMDGGATWTHFDTTGATKDNWVIWHFTYTPESDSAYVLSVRSVNDAGQITEEPVEIMFNAETR